MKTRNKAPDANRDPITGEPGAHPVGTGIGAVVGGAAVGAAAGAAAGPVGGLVGTVAGAFAGGLAGHAAAERFDPTVEDAYWRENFEREAYYEPGMTYDDYWPAYRLGYEARARYPEMEFVDIEIQLAEDYEKSRGKSRLGWDRAKHAVRAAWDRIEHAVKGKSGKDAR